MREMKDSGIAWIGEIPSDWEIRRIKTLPIHDDPNAFVDGDWIESPFITDEGIRYLTTGNVGDGKYKEQGSGYISEETFEKLNCKFAYPGDFVISRLNAPYGRACILPNIKERYVLAVDVVILRTDENKRYLCYLSQCTGYQRSVEDMARGTAMKRISRTNLGTIQLPIPSLHEQNIIADLLDEKCSQVDALISNVQTQIERLKSYKQSLITEVVTKGLDSSAPMRDSEVEWIGVIPEHWGIAKLQYCSDIRSGITLGKNHPAGTILVERPYLRVANVQSGGVVLDNLKTINVTAEEDVQYRLSAGEVLMTEGGDRDKLGRGCVWEGQVDPCLHQNHIFALQTNNLLNPYFLSYVTASAVGRVYFDITAIKTTNLACTNSSKVMAFKLPLPTVDEQERIVSFLNAKCGNIDQLIAIKQKKIDKLNEYKKSLIYEYVTGKREVV